jgi:hypothetical protein
MRKGGKALDKTNKFLRIIQIEELLSSAGI